MTINGDTITIDTPLGEENIEELDASLSQDEIRVIEIVEENLSSGILQLIWCSGKEIKCESEFLSKIFYNVKRAS